MKKVLIIRFSAIGDIVLTTPFLRMVKTTFPQWRLDFLVKDKYKEILEYNPHINDILTLGSNNFRELIKEIRKKKYDLLIDLQMSIRSWLVSILSGIFRRKTYSNRRFKRFILIHFKKNLYKGIIPVPQRFLEAVKDLGVNDDGKGADFYFAPALQKKIVDMMHQDGIKNGKSFIVLAPGAGRETKRWPADNYSKVGRYLVKQGYAVVTIGDKRDKELCDQVVRNSKEIKNYAGRLSLGQVAALLSQAELLITNDTGIMHIGTAVTKNVIAIFGPTTEVLGFFPFRGNARVIEKKLNCRPCSYHGTDTCPRKHFNCMRSISVNEIIEETRNMLQRK